jgi:hypothetical protein
MRKTVRASLAARLSSRTATLCRVTAFLMFAALVAAPVAVGAQAWAYPSFQPPRVMNREFNFGIADAGDAGTSLLFQWREGLNAESQLSFDGGFADPDGNSNGKVLLGVQYGYLLNHANAELPLDFLLTGGLNFAVGGGSDLFRIPVGVSIGHRFALEDGFAITPYVHPRMSFDNCTECGSNGDSRSDLGIDFDIGANFEVTKQLSFRVSALFGGSDAFGNADGFGISLAWAPVGLSKMIRR